MPNAVVENEKATIPTWVTSVVGVAEVTPRIRQITVAGGLDGFAPLGPDQFVYVLAPPPGRSRLTVDTTFSWEAYQEMPEAERPVGAYYTVRRWDRSAGSIDLWVVLHGHDGHGERWGRTARPGDPVALWGPRQAFEPPAGTRDFVLVGDETALPAIAAILESLGPADRATVVAVIEHAAHTIALPSQATTDVTWVERTTGANPLLAELRDRPHPLDPGTYVWGGGESHEMTALRRHVRDAVGLPQDQVSLTGYWRADATEAER